MDPTIKQFQLTGVAAESYGGAKQKGKTRKAKKEPGSITIDKEEPVKQVKAVVPPPPAPPSPAPAPPAPAPVKVVLAAAKKRAVVLAPKPVVPTKKTRKASRSIKVSMAGLNKRMTRAKTIRKDASSLGLSEVKTALHKAGLIKAESKAPETILRQMYADYMMLKERAL